MHVEDSERSIFVISSSKKNQSLIIVGRVQPRITISRDSDEDLETLELFHYALSVHCMMKRMGYDLCRGDGLNFGTGRRIPLQSFVLKGKPANYYDQTRKGG